MATVILLASLALPHRAEAQARGTLQATATVVDTRTSFASLEAVRNVLRPAGEQRAVATVAQVSTRRSEERPTVVVVTIDYARN